jgi:hypothetical protein
LGIAEVSDCLTIVVSEETSAISIAENGRIFSVDEKQLKDYLRRVILNDTTTIEKGSRRRSSLLMEDDVVVEIQEDDRRRGFSLFRRNEEEESEHSSESDMKGPFNNRNKQNGSKTSPFSSRKTEERIEIENNLDKEAYDESAE